MVGYQHCSVAADEAEAHRLTESLPLVAKRYALALADKILTNPYRMAPRLQDRVALGDNLAGGGPEGVLGQIADVSGFSSIAPAKRTFR